MPTDAVNSLDSSQRHLVAVLDAVREALQRYAGTLPFAEEPVLKPEAAPPQAWNALETLTTAFGLSNFEQSVLILCAGMELDSSFSSLCVAAHGESGWAYPTYSLALAALPDAHWSALSPASPLRHWKLIEVLQQPGSRLTTSPLRVDERILHFLVNVQHLDERLIGIVQPITADGDLVPSHQRHAEQIAKIWSTLGPDLPLLQLAGADDASRRSIAASACAQLGFRLYTLPAELIPSGGPELDSFIRLWEREAVLTSAALYLDTDAMDVADGKAAAQVSRFLQLVGGPVLVSARERWRPLQRPVRVLEVHKPTSQEQHSVWKTTLGDRATHLNGELKHLVAQFNLPASGIRVAVDQVLTEGSQDDDLLDALWDASCSQARPRLETLAQRIEPVAQWDDLVLPTHEKSMLRDIALHVRHRSTVYESWGFGGKSKRGLGVSALFSGTSGTGKTMAAEVLANELRLDLFRIDLSGVVSKYIGETEKNLRQVFDAAEEGGTILFFDEADALFGKRSEVKDSHDRYANIEINYLLQRIESYRGLAVLATNMRNALDTAFLRRLRFVVNFPFPDVVQRAEIWRRSFPSAMPLGQLDMDKLARLDIAGGNIRNVALHAAFLAAGKNQPLEMADLVRAARTEFAKIDKPVPESEIAHWS